MYQLTHKAFEGSEKIWAPFTRHLVETGLFAEFPMRIIDIGARGGMSKRWEIYSPYVDLIGFEPDVEECERLNKLSPKDIEFSGRQTYYPTALHRQSGDQTMYVTRVPGNASFFKQNVPLLDRFQMWPVEDPTTVLSTPTIKTIDLDTFVAHEEIDYVDFIKIDVEGSELAVLEGAERLISGSVCGLITEVMFAEEYLGQPLFCDTDAYLKTLGFTLFELDLYRWRRKGWTDSKYVHPYEKGQVLCADALYLRDLPAELEKGAKFNDKDRIKVLKLASVAEVLDLQDFSVELLANAEKIGLLGANETHEMISLLRTKKKDIFNIARSAFRKIVPLFIRSKGRQLLDRFLSA